MRIKKLIHYINIIPLFILLLILAYGFKSDDKNGKHLNKTVQNMNKVSSGKVGDGYRMYINNLNVPLNNIGVIAEVNLPDGGKSNGYYGNHEFLFAGGFFLSGTRNGSSWANAVASATLVKDYVPGTIEGGQSDPRAQLYVLNSADEPFGQSWQDWKDAVDLGADFYDGDGDGVYNPVDKNANAKWDVDEDAPDLMGDETVWCVYNDGLEAAQRRWNTISPLGIEVRQTVFGFASAGAIGNLLFVRYRIKYVGLNKPDDPETLNDVYLGVWADPDVGEVNGYKQNLVGCDTIRNAGFTYLKDPSAGDWESQPPCFIIDFFSGPAAFIPGVTYVDNNGNGVFDAGDTALDSAYSVRGKMLGINSIPGARNQPLSSFVEYINGNSVLNDPDDATQARNLILGLSRTGEVVDPCTWSFGSVNGGVDCNSLNPGFWYSGDPVANNGVGYGWINTLPADIRQMSNTGPFELRKGEEKEIVVAYVVGQGVSPLNSVTIAKSIDDGAQFIFDHNFVAPSPAPAVVPQVSSGEDFIDLTWNSSPQVSFYDSTDAYNNHFEGYNIYAYQSNTTAPTVNNVSNRTLLARYTVDGFINDLYTKDRNTGGIELLYASPDAEHQLNKNIYSDPQTGRMRIRITQDPFTGGPLVKGKPYYFSITSYSPNYYALIYKQDETQPVGTVGDYYVDPNAFVGIVENIPKITQVVLAEDMYNPPLEIVNATKVSGHSFGDVGYDIVDRAQLTNQKYQVTFFKDSSSASYKMFWKLKNLSTNTVLIDSSDEYLYADKNFVAHTLTDGFITKVEDQTATLGTASYSPTSNTWYDAFSPDDATGIYYVGQDIPQGTSIKNFANKQSTYITADKLRKIELRFGTSGKAYRYINGYIGTAVGRANAYTYAEAIAPGDTVGKGVVGNWDSATDRANGFVDVPFTAWVVDDNFPQDTRQLAVGFIERRKTTNYPKGNPDGIWDPGDSLNASGEVIVIFDANYDPTGSQKEYTGGEFNSPTSGTVTVWADLLRAASGLQTPPADAIGFTADQRKKFLSSWSNAMYVVGLQRQDASSFYHNGDALKSNITVYPYTEESVYEFTTPTPQLSVDEEKVLFDKVNVYPNPLYGFNPATSYDNSPSDDPFVTFSNLPNDVTITIYSLSGSKLRTLTTSDKSSPSSPFLRWDLKNDSSVRVASGLYLAIVDSPKLGQKILKFSIIMPQKQLQKY